MIKKTHPEISHLEETVNVKLCVSIVLQYMNVYGELVTNYQYFQGYNV